MHRPDRIRPRIPFDSAPVGLLRGQGCDPRLHRFAAQRTDPRRVEGAADDGAVVGLQHTAVRLGAQRAATARAISSPPSFNLDSRLPPLLAATHGRREVWVGWPAVKAILSSRVLPGVGDWMAVRVAYDGQQTNETAAPDRPDNLFVPVAGPFAAHGRFDSTARRTSLQWRLSTHRWLVAAGVGVTLVGLMIFAP